MINNLTYLNDHWGVPVLIAALLLFAVFLCKEWFQNGKHRFVPKVVLIFLAIAALAFIALKPALPTEETMGNIVLLTEGYQSKKLDSLKKENRRLRQFEYLPGQALPEEMISAERVFILGSGIKAYDLWQLDGIPALYLGGNANEGVVKLKYQQERSIGVNLILKGLYKNPKSGNRLFLNAPGGAALDSVTLNAEVGQEFQLAAELKVAGNYVYTLSEKDSLGEILSSDPVPVKVLEKTKIKVLLVNSFPTFETKYLKNFLSEAGHEVVVRSQITRGRFKYEYFNTGRVPINNLSENTLEAFDLLIIDAATLRTLSIGQINAIDNTIRNKGLGLIIQADDAYFSASGKLYPLKFERALATEATAAQWPGIKLTAFPFRILNDFGLQPIHRSGNEITSAYKRAGKGRVGSSVFSTTWQLVLNGQNEVYKELWSQVVEQVSKQEDPVTEWQQEAKMGSRDEPINFVIRTENPNPVLSSDFGTIPLIQHPDFPDVWSGTTWPRQQGWNSMKLDTTAIFDYYVAEENHWRPLTAFKTRLANLNYFQGRVPAENTHQPTEPLNSMWFYGVFLLCIGGLWLEPKL